RSRVRAQQGTITRRGNRPVTEIIVSHLRGAVQHCHHNPAPVQVLPPTKASGNASNAIVDSGTNGIYLDKPVFKEVLARFSSLALEDEIHAGYLPMSKLKLADWPVLTFVLEGALGSDVTLRVTPQTYWQTNAPKAGHASLAFYTGDSPSILGLPLMNNYLTVLIAR
ncbi:hypothetical protein ABIB73_006451, partial [Bradyrhizobium sp. F1.4.3]|uniref:hypothetical protein n=1 Tax=Bradyrhizobium sp. F1.4.3 TaxID=3156356 RepID=UPI003391D5F7